MIGDYSIGDIIALSRKAFSQLEQRLNIPNTWQVLPAAQTLSHNELGVCTLDVDITNFGSRIKLLDFNNAVIDLKRLIYYQILNNFWDTPAKIDLGIREQSLTKLEGRINIIDNHIEERRKQIEILISGLDAEKTKLSEFTQGKQAEYVQLKNNQNESNTILADIKNKQQNTTSIATDTEQLKQKCEKIETLLSQLQDKSTAKQKEINDLYNTATTGFDNIQTNAQNMIDNISSNFSAVSKYTAEVKNMMGYIKDGTLAHSFNKRKGEVETRVKWWTGISGGLLILMVIWICIVFFKLSANTGYAWADIIINGIKSSPLVFAFGYALNEMSKERNLLEEYAFREAIAVTLTAYLEQLKDTETGKSCETLLTSTIEKLYTKPVISNREYKMINFSVKDAKDILSEATNVLKSVK